MSKTYEPMSILKELEHAERVLNNLLHRLTSLYTNLEQMESVLRVNDFSSSGMIVPGMMTGIVCALTADISTDPLHKALESLKGKGLKLPTIIKGSDRTESAETCDSFMKIIKAQFNLRTTQLIVNLRWSSLPPIIENDNVVIIGTRYIHGESQDITRFKNRLKGLDIQVFEDNGEFGGGLLTYKLTSFAREADNVIVLELTLSSALSEDVTRIAKILEAIAAP